MDTLCQIIYIYKWLTIVFEFLYLFLQFKSEVKNTIDICGVALAVKRWKPSTLLGGPACCVSVLRISAQNNVDFFVFFLAAHLRIIEH
jgi:hypothetical protein